MKILPSVEKVVAEGGAVGAKGQSPLWVGPPGPAGLPNIRRAFYNNLKQNNIF